MTFLQPVLLWALPLILLPVVIHFLNRMRHRPQPWAAMRFLVSATRNSVSNTKLRQFLILLFRVLCVLMLILFLARPMTGGWMGWALSPAPDAILILLDRSPSMESQSGGATKREQAVKLLAQAAKQFENASHLVLIDSATRAPQEIAKSASLANLPLTQPTDAAADIPAMLSSAFDWLIENRAGSAEIWIASDCQRSNWMPEDPRWKHLTAQLGSLTQKVRIRLLALNEPSEANTSIALKEITRRQKGSSSELQFVLDLQCNRTPTAPIPVSLNLDGERSQSEVVMEGQSLRWRHRVDLGTRKNGGWGSFELPADANRRDNTAYFVYGPATPLRATIVSANPESARYFQLASGGQSAQPAEVLSPSEFSNASLTNNSLIVWQEPIPTGTAAERLRQFAEEGGVVIFFPPGVRPSPGAATELSSNVHESPEHNATSHPAPEDGRTPQQFNGIRWGEIQETGEEKPFRVLRWDQDQGPLAKSDERMSLPLPQTSFFKRQAFIGTKNTLAAFEDGTPFLARQTVGRGDLYFCASLPQDDWSSLGEGTVLVPMMQRLLQSGARRLQQAASVVCGELSATDKSRHWVSIDTPGKDIRFQAGVYRDGERLLAVNRPPSEDEPEILDTDETKKLFGDLPFQSFQERRTTESPLQGEIWRLFLFGLLVFLIIEGILILPHPPVKGGDK